VAVRREVKVPDYVCILSEDITGALLCNFPYLEAEKIRKKVGYSKGRESTLNCPSKCPTARYLPSREKQRHQMLLSELSKRKLPRKSIDVLQTGIKVADQLFAPVFTS